MGRTMTELLILNEEHVPKLPRHAKLRFDEARNKWIINAPERVFELDDIKNSLKKKFEENKNKYDTLIFVNKELSNFITIRKVEELGNIIITSKII